MTGPSSPDGNGFQCEASKTPLLRFSGLRAAMSMLWKVFQGMPSRSMYAMRLAMVFETTTSSRFFILRAPLGILT